MNSMKLQRWRVLRSRFPVAAPNEVLGYVDAPNRRSAEIRASVTYGPQIVVERVTRTTDEPTTQESSR